jgi:branched-chain amino acid transport system substrate-binding protein
VKKQVRYAIAAALVAATSIAITPAQAEIRIGAIFSVTGPAAFLGEPERRTVELYVDRINTAGGVNGEKIKLIAYDDGADANKARLLAQRLIDDDKVVAIIGSTLTGPSLAIGSVASEAKIPVMALGGGVPIAEPVKPWVFKVGHTDRMICQKIFGELQARKLTKIGLVAGTDAFGNSMRNECLKQAKTHDITIVVDERHGPQDSDITPQLTNVRSAAGLQAVVHTGFGETATIFARNYRQLGITVPLYESAGVAAPNYIKLTGAAAEGVRLPAPAVLVYDQLAKDDSQYKVVTDYAKAYQAKYNEPASQFGGFAYDALHMLVMTYQKNKTTDPAKTRETLEAIGPYVGVTGTFNFSAKDHLGLDLSSFRMVEVSGGSFRLKN